MMNTIMMFGSKLLRPVRNEKGAQAIEYVGLVALVVILILALIPLFGEGNDSIAKMLVDKIKDFINKISI
ncbi:Flp family type IVb pilin [Paenibacillus glycanilyticus]|uniref:Flp family type IVb pilin n=1 Tax=Paenibacillus glycanilyticus TaxID=126569 RepID=A0ABQ6GEQ2_9BACL|nr:hypothetical protein [Paenibacillus glycanilyticus]GLX68720.1 hypothetical protein MU1_30650 [Paenibacillus glycanilyticus]